MKVGAYYKNVEHEQTNSCTPGGHLRPVQSEWNSRLCLSGGIPSKERREWGDGGRSFTGGQQITVKEYN